MSCLRTLGAVILSFSALIAVSGPSAALSCVPHPSAGPEAVLSGEAELVGEGTFWERYDLVIPQVYRDHPGVVHLLETLNSDAFKQALSAQHGYDIRETGVVQYEG